MSRQTYEQTIHEQTIHKQITCEPVDTTNSQEVPEVFRREPSDAQVRDSGLTWKNPYHNSYGLIMIALNKKLLSKFKGKEFKIINLKEITGEREISLW